MKTLRYVNNSNIKKVNESADEKQFTKKDFNAAAKEALAELDDVDINYALKQINNHYPVRLIQGISDTLTNAMDNWCIEHGFEEGAWLDFGDLDDVFFVDDENEDKDTDVENTEETENNIQPSEQELRAYCYNIVYNTILSKMSPKNTDTIAELPYAFYCGFMGEKYNITGDDAPIYQEAYDLGVKAAEIKNYAAFVNYLELEYDI